MAEADGTLNRAVELLAQCRAEITAIETALGTNVHGSAASLAARLAVRHSQTGLRRGRLHMLRGPNAVGGSKSSASKWFQGGTVYLQGHLDGPFVATPATITYPSAYFAGAAPKYVIAKYVDGTLGSLFYGGSVQVLYDQITVTQFKVACKQRDGTGAWVSGGSVNGYYVAWLAFGGAPA